MAVHEERLKAPQVNSEKKASSQEMFEALFFRVVNKNPIVNKNMVNTLTRLCKYQTSFFCGVNKKAAGTSVNKL